MASNGHGQVPGQDNPSDNQPIPLQDLSRQPGAAVTGRGRRRSSSGSIAGGGSVYVPTRSLITGGSVRTYERIAEDSPSPTERAGFHLTQPSTARSRPQRSPYVSDGDNESLVDDLGGFAQAVGSIGLSFDGPRRTHPLAGSSTSINDDEGYMMGAYPGGGARGSVPSMDDVFVPIGQSEDTAPLTDKRYLQPISGAPGAEEEEEQERTSFQSVRLGNQFGSRLGDDLEGGMGGRRRGNSNAGEGGRSRSRSLSPSASGSALSVAGSVMRMMSQRVVNLSNEPELVEQSMRRNDSIKNARLDGPPSLPAIVDYDQDSSQESKHEKHVSSKAWKDHSNPLRGKSLGIFAPDNPLRMWLCDILVHPITEPFILVVIIIQTILLTIESAQSVYDHPRSKHWGSSSLDYSFFVIFVIYTLELIARIIVSGFILNPVEYSTLNRSLGLKKALAEKGKSLFTLQREPSTKKKPAMAPEPQLSLLRTFTGMEPPVDMSDDLRHRQRIRLAHRAFLRHSFNRLDFVAVVSYWISFFLSMVGYEFSHHIYIFEMMSCLRILRLLGITNGTSVILRSLKKAAPLLVHVAFLIGFFWLLFAIVGIQSFKSSFRRTCVWIDPKGQNNFTMNDPYNVLQFCGGYLDPNTGSPMPWVYANGEPSGFQPKGYLCPQGSMCVEGTNPYDGTVSFDNILQSLELVFVIMSSNTFTDLLYYTTNSDYLAAALFFAVGLVVMSLWMVNLLVAVITSSFQVIREESKRSAFAMEKIDDIDQQEKTPRKVSTLKRIYDKTEGFWVALIALDLCVQCLRSATMGPDRAATIDVTEKVVTLFLLVEIIIRFASDWRRFHKSKRNLVDLGLAVITCIIQIPPIHNSGQPYAVLSLFQVLRVYRVVLAFSLTRDLIMVVFRNVVGLLNLILFVFLITFLAAIFAVKLFRGQIPQQDPDGNTIHMTFYNIYNAFLGMYQILSSENWTTILYNSTNFTVSAHTAWISASFFTMWFILANFIVLNMFIAVIQESFDVSEDQKRLHQVKAFLQQKEVGGSSTGNLALTTIFKLGRDEDRYRDPLDHGPASMEMLLKDAVVREFLDEQGPIEHGTDSLAQTAARPGSDEPGLLSRWWNKLTMSIRHREPNPFYSKLKFSRAYDELDPRTLAKEVVMASEQRKRAQREYLRRHPNYNKSLFIFAPDNPIRRACQRMVGPGRGHQRFEGVDPYKPLWFSFSAFIYAAIVAMVLLACITTPIYQKQYFQNGQSTGSNWFVWTDIGFAVLFTIEAIIKVIADGFFWTPNAYFRSAWGFIDGIVLITLWINVFTSLFNNGSVARFVGAFKALRALRLLNVSDSARDTFYSVIIVGGWKVISAAFVSMSFLIPFAIYGLNLFNGQLKQCNDGNLQQSNLTYCIGEYQSSPFNWDVLAPRAVDNPYFNFDNFADSLFILFQIVSQEGWIDVQWAVMSITGVGQQPQDFASPANGLFFVVFNLLGSVFVLTLFVSVFMRNYTEQTGVAFLTAEQRSWLELRKLLRQIAPSKRSIDSNTKKWRLWCYRIAVKKHGRWAKFITTILLLHLLLLTLEFYPSVPWWDALRDAFFFIFTWFYIANVVIRIFGLGWRRFRRSSWDLYSLVAVPGTFITTILAFIFPSQASQQLKKLFLVAMTLLIIPRNNQLDQLFKTAAASIPAIGNLLATWFVLFLVFAIAMTQTFGLTKFGANENNNLNFRDVSKALIFLFRTSCGEGWNQLMEDYATMRPPYCTSSDNFFNSDCGSAGWARSLFIAWNIISMYIFVSLFVSLIFESFSYVYQRSSGLYAISRDDIRRFKEAWATFDPDGTGFISKAQFPRLLGELSGVFEMRIYDGEFTVGRILEQCRVRPRDSLLSYPKNRLNEEIDLRKLAQIVDRIPVETIRARRHMLNNFYEEVLVSADPERGIAFSACLMILAHYKVINDSKSLRLEEYLRRRTRLQRVEEQVRRNTVIGFFDTLYWSRQFRRRMEARKSARMTAVPQFSVPEILVDAQEDENPEKDKDITSGPSSPLGSPRSLDVGGSRPSSKPKPSLTIDTNAGRGSAGSSPTEWERISSALSPRLREMDTALSLSPLSPRLRDLDTSLSPLSPRLREMDTEYHGAAGQTSPAGSPSPGHDNSTLNVQDMMQSLGDSAWGESIRRSFTHRRPE
ncbi:hypothetical protein VTN77DRAFT_9231 [Rasamsonia byssochlamydoides]|uniref:uncharacterized protein n=1 Tax=Rasamsonia byssochlamydoides TaxID=89139 RepID=UPI00374465BA